MKEKSIEELYDTICDLYGIELLKSFSYRKKIKNLELCIEDILTISSISSLSSDDILTIIKKYKEEI